MASKRVSGAEIGALLSGREIEDREAWRDQAWQRRQTADGAVEYGGIQIQPGVSWKAIGKSWIEDDMLCERWPEAPEPLELCSMIFRIPEGDTRIRWWDYVMVTDTGSHSFRLVK